MMPIDPVPKSLYPFVPKYPGVPPLLRAGATLIDTITLGFLGASDALNSLIGTEVVKWGVFDSNGTSIGDYDSFSAVGYNNNSKVSTYPVEQGSFAAYNKVDTPFDVVVYLNCGGDDNRRANFLVAIEAARKSLQLYTVMSPDVTYKNVNFTTIAVRREREDGGYMIKAILTGIEVRQKASAAFSDPKSPSGHSDVDVGQVQTVDDPTIDVSGVA